MENQTPEQEAQLENLYDLSKKLLLSLSSLFIISFIKGLALKILWIWFIVPTFNLPQLNLAQCLGLIILINYLFTHSFKKNKVKQTLESLSVDFVINEVNDCIKLFLIVMIFSYFIHLFI